MSKKPRPVPTISEGVAEDSAVLAPVAEAAAEAVETAAETPAAIVETMEADASPAVTSDVNPAAAEAEPLYKGPAAMASVYNPADTVEKTQAFFGDVQDRMKTGFERSTKLSEDMVEFAKGNVEALMASARVAAKAGETIGQDAADYSRKSFESATAAFKSFATVKSPTELFQLQSEFAKASFDSAVAEASKLSETMIKYAGEIAQPLSNRYALAAEKLKGSVA